jgi:hypothetical protein
MFNRIVAERAVRIVNRLTVTFEAEGQEVATHTYDTESDALDGAHVWLHHVDRTRSPRLFTGRAS